MKKYNNKLSKAISIVTIVVCAYQLIGYFLMEFIVLMDSEGNFTVYKLVSSGIAMAVLTVVQALIGFSIAEIIQHLSDIKENTDKLLELNKG